MDGLTGLDDVDVALRFDEADGESLALLKALFADDDYLEQRAFSGTDLFVVVAKLTEATIGKLLELFARQGANAPATTMEIGSLKVSITGMSRQDMDALLASPGFRSAAKAANRM